MSVRRRPEGDRGDTPSKKRTDVSTVNFLDVVDRGAHPDRVRHQWKTPVRTESRPFQCVRTKITSPDISATRSTSTV